MSDLRQRQGWRPLLTPMGCTDQEPHRHQRQRHVVMPPLPGAYLILIHADLTFASFEACFNAGARLDHPPQFPKRRLLEGHLAPISRREVVMIAVAGVLLSGIPRGAGLQRPVVRERTPSDHQPLLGSQAFALDPRLYPAFD